MMNEEIKTALDVLKMESQQERVEYLSEKIGAIKWCPKCEEMNPRTSVNLWDHKTKCSCGTVVVQRVIQDFL